MSPLIKKMPLAVLNNTAQIIPLGSGQEAIVDPDDFPRLINHYWRAVQSSCHVYASRRIMRNGKFTYIRMHREITQCPPGMVVHHKNGNTLDNQKCNLEIMTVAENNQQKKTSRKIGDTHNTLPKEISIEPSKKQPL